MSNYPEPYLTEQKHAYTQNFIANMVKDYHNGMKLHDLASKYNTSPTYVYNYLNKNDRRKRKALNYHQQIIDNYLHGEKTETIAFKYGISRQSVYNIVKNSNVPMRKGRPRK